MSIALATYLRGERDGPSIRKLPMGWVHVTRLIAASLISRLCTFHTSLRVW